jgi:hypothetical protein
MSLLALTESARTHRERPRLIPNAIKESREIPAEVCELGLKKWRNGLAIASVIWWH